MEADDNKNYYKLLNFNLKKYTHEIFDQVLKSKNNLYLARVISDFFISKQNVLVKIQQLFKFSKKKKVVIIEPSFINKYVSESVNGDFYTIASLINNLNVIKLKDLNVRQDNLARDPISSFWTRLKFESLNSIFFRLFVIFSNLIFKFYRKNIILYSHENSLLKGTAAKIFLKGYRLKKIQTSNIINKKSDINVNKEFLKTVKKIFTKYTNSILKNDKKKIISKFLFEDLCFSIFQYLKITKEMKEIINSEVKALLIGTPNSLVEIAAIEESNKRNILTASFQHGISKEISKDISCISTMYESNISRLYFIYNSAAYNVLKSNRFNKSENIMVGLPEDMRVSISKKFRKKYFGGFLYATTNLYSGNRGIPSRSGTSDYNKAKFEIELIEDVFKKISNTINYKPYFSKRFTGAQIELEKINKIKNINLIKNEIDLRYLLKYFKVIITSRATSTIGWCLLSNRPIIYIENLDNRLSKRAYQEFKKNLFFFDVKDRKWKSKLKNFLSKSIFDIEKEWKVGAIQRKSFIEEFFGDITSNAEDKCAKIIHKKIINKKNDT